MGGGTGEKRSGMLLNAKRVTHGLVVVEFHEFLKVKFRSAARDRRNRRRRHGCGRGARAYPNAEEMRMVRAIALLALLEALRNGEYRATFHGFRVEAHRRTGPASSTPTVEVSLAVTLGGMSSNAASSPSTRCLRHSAVVNPIARCPMELKLSVRAMVTEMNSRCSMRLACHSSGRTNDVLRWLSQPVRCTLRIVLCSQSTQTGHIS